VISNLHQASGQWAAMAGETDAFASASGVLEKT